jgi:hypothetical protein
MRGKLDVYGDQQVVEIGCQVASGGIRENLADLSDTEDCVAFTVESIKVKRFFMRYEDTHTLHCHGFVCVCVCVCVCISEH